MTAARDAYLFGLAAVCNVDPRRVDRLTVRDFGRLTVGLEAMIEARKGN